MRFCCLSLLLFLPLLLCGQSTKGNYVLKQIPTMDTMKIKISAPIFPHTFKCFAALPYNPNNVDTLGIDFIKLSNEKIVFSLDNTLVLDSVWVSYRNLPKALAGPFFDFDSTLVTERVGEYIGIDDNDYETQSALFKNDQLNYDGNFLRSLSLGNNQSLVFNSGLDLHMSGNLAGDVKVEAAITDQNIPLQPEGNTANIRELDKVFIRLSKQGHSVVFGDFQKINPQGYFMRYNKKLQGVDYSFKGTISKESKTKVEASAFGSISRGKFNNFQVPTVEGNQGPYKLLGAQGENFIIIQSGTEKVYMDGVLLKRGADLDYVVDYNLGEITFMHRILMTKDKRIFVEFEYTDITYQKSLVGGAFKIENEKWSSFVNIYSEQDNKNKSETPLSDIEKEQLKNIGDQIDSVFVSSVQEKQEGITDFSVTYDIIDTLVDGVLYNDILIFDIDSTTTKYTAKFTNVGENQGNYIFSNANVNGRVFIWVAPDANGELQGNFEPIERVKTPLVHQMINVGGTYTVNKNLKISAEGSYSRRNPNTFADAQPQHNGQALVTKLDYSQPFKLKKTNWVLKNTLRYEYTSLEFKPLQRYRAAEYKRDWSIGDQDQADEHNLSWKVGLSLPKYMDVNYKLASLNINSVYKGLKHEVDLNFAHKKTKVVGRYNHLNATTSTLDNEFIRPSLRIDQRFLKDERLNLFAFYEEEKRLSTAIGSDVYNGSSFRFQIYGVGATYKVKDGLTLEMTRKQRMDFIPDSTQLVLGNDATEYDLNANFKKGKAYNGQLGFKSRTLSFQSDTVSNKDTYAAYLTNQVKLFNGGLNIHIGYQLGTGQTPKLLYYYSQVDAGQGIYKWSDYNDDGIQQQTEFEISDTPDQANFLRFTQISNEFIRTNNTQLTTNVKLRFSKLLKGKAKTKTKTKAKKVNKSKKYKHLKRLNLRSGIKISKKSLEGNVDGFVPFILNTSDTSIVSMNASILNVIKYDGPAKAIKVEVGQKVFKNKELKINGSFWRNKVTYHTNLRKTIAKKFNVNLRFEQDKESNDDVDEIRDFKIEGQKYTLGVDFFKGSAWRGDIKYDYRLAMGFQEDQQEDLNYHNLKASINYAKDIQNSFIGSFGYTKVDYTGKTNEPLGFALLQTLKQGNNFNWQVGIQKLINKNLVLIFEYNGRKNGTSNIIHLGSMQINATF